MYDNNVVDAIYLQYFERLLSAEADLNDDVHHEYKNEKSQFTCPGFPIENMSFNNLMPNY